MRHMGVDPGAKRIGLAVSDEDGMLALPHATLPGGNEESAARAIAEKARELDVSRIVVGLPLKLSGREGASARRARRLANAIERTIDVPVLLWDERLTTAAAERSLSQLGIRGARRREVVDQSAAALILQSYLDASRQTWRGEEETSDPGEPDGGDSVPPRPRGP